MITASERGGHPPQLLEKPGVPVCNGLTLSRYRHLREVSTRHIGVCAQAKNGEAAVEKRRQLGPDLIILDISMPMVGGIEAAQQIRAFLPDVPRSVTRAIRWLEESATSALATKAYLCAEQRSRY